MEFILHHIYSEFQISKFPRVGDKLYIHLEVSGDFPLHAYLGIHWFKHHASNLRMLIRLYHSSGGRERYMKLLWIFVTMRTGNIFDFWVNFHLHSLIFSHTDENLNQKKNLTQILLHLHFQVWFYDYSVRYEFCLNSNRSSKNSTKPDLLLSYYLLITKSLKLYLYLWVQGYSKVHSAFFVISEIMNFVDIHWINSYND